MAALRMLLALTALPLLLAAEPVAAWDLRISLRNGQSFVLATSATLDACRVDKRRLDAQHRQRNLGPEIEVSCVPSAGSAPPGAE